MRIGLLSFAVVALAAAGAFGTTAFNYANGVGRTATITVVTDANAYVSLADPSNGYTCYLSVPSTGKIAISFGAACNSGTGTGVNPGSVTYWENLLIITNKGDKSWTNFWANSSDTNVYVNLTYSTDASMTIGSDWTKNNGAFASTVGIGNALYMGLKVDATSKDASAGWGTAPTITFAARSTA